MTVTLGTSEFRLFVCSQTLHVRLYLKKQPFIIYSSLFTSSKFEDGYQHDLKLMLC